MSDRVLVSHRHAGSRVGATWVLPVVTALAGLAACTVVALVDPAQPGRYGICPFYGLTGRWCPACGGLRGMNRLLNGDVAGAVGYNLLLLPALGLTVWAWAVWAAPRLGRPPLRGPRLRMRTGWMLFGGVLLFWVLRNLPVAPLTALAP